MFDYGRQELAVSFTKHKDNSKKKKKKVNLFGVGPPRVWGPPETWGPLTCHWSFYGSFKLLV